MIKPLTATTLLDRALPEPQAEGDKEDRGAVLVVAGGGGVPGAAILTGVAALRVGAGKLKLAAPRAFAFDLGVAVPEALVIVAPTSPRHEFLPGAARALRSEASASNALIVGPGMLGEEAARALALDLLRAHEAGFVIDAAALPDVGCAEAFARHARGRVVLTPHAGEMAGMLSWTKADVLANPLSAAREAANLFGSVVIMKGATTHIVSPSGETWRHEGGVSGLGTSGSGDVLSGAIGGLLARGCPAMDAALWGVFLHAAAGARLARKVGPLGFLASELLGALPRVMARKG